MNTPALRERGQDIPELLRFFAHKFAGQGQVPISFAPDFMGVLQTYAWPGNVRELSNLVDRFNALFSGQQLSLAMVPPSFLPKGLRDLQAELAVGTVADTLALSPYASNEQNRFDIPHELDLVGATPTPHNDVEDIIMLAQGLPCLPPEGLSLKDCLAGIERDLILQALNRAGGNVSQTARLLNLQRTTLIVKLDKYELRGLDGQADSADHMTECADSNGAAAA
jgi:sigma-54 specific flagellar transcriptional regulator A